MKVEKRDEYLSIILSQQSLFRLNHPENALSLFASQTLPKEIQTLPTGDYVFSSTRTAA